MCCRVALEQFVNGIHIEGAVKDDLDRSIAADDLHVPQRIKKRFLILCEKEVSRVSNGNDTSSP